MVEAVRANAPVNGVYLDERGVFATVAIERGQLSPRFASLVVPMTTQLLVEVVVAFLLAWLLLRLPLWTAVGTGILFASVAVAAGVAMLLSQSIWYGFPLNYQLANLVDLAVGWFLLGIMLASFRRTMDGFGRSHEQRARYDPVHSRSASPRGDDPSTPRSVRTRSLTVARYLDYETVSDPEPSPDGGQVVFTRRSVDKMKDQFETGLWLMNADGSKLRFLVKGSSPVWSPDGTRIAYLAEAEPGGPQLFVRYMDAEGSMTQVTKVSHAPGGPRWSPDGKWIGFTMFVPKENTWRIDMPAAARRCDLDQRPPDRGQSALSRRSKRIPGDRILPPLPGSRDRRHPAPDHPGRMECGTARGWRGQRGGWDWMPDGKSIVVAGLDSPDAERTYQRTALYLVDVATGREAPDHFAGRRLEQPGGFGGWEA